MGALIAELLKTQAHVAAGRMALWTTLGLVAGLFLAWLIHVIANRRDAWNVDVAFVGAVRMLCLIWLYLGLAVLGGLLGFAEGSLRGVEVIVRESQFRHEVLRRAGEYASLGVAWMDLYLAGREPASPMSEAERERRWQAFARGEAELDAPEMLARLERSQEALVNEAAEAARARLRRLEGYGGGLVGRLVEMGLTVITHRYTRGAITWLLGREGTDVSSFFIALPAAAAAHGSPRGISHAELSTHIVERTLVPNLLSPARLFVRAQQAMIAAFVPLVPLPPLLLFWAARRLERWRKSRTALSPASQGELHPPGGHDA